MKNWARHVQRMLMSDLSTNAFERRLTGSFGGLRGLHFNPMACGHSAIRGALNRERHFEAWPQPSVDNTGDDALVAFDQHRKIPLADILSREVVGQYIG